MALFWCCTNIVYRHYHHFGEAFTCTTPEGGRKGSQRKHSTELTTNTRPTDATTGTTTTSPTSNDRTYWCYTANIWVMQRRQQVKQDRQQQQHQRQHQQRPLTLTGRRTQRTTAPGDWSMKFTDTTWIATTTTTIITTSNSYETTIVK